MAGDFGQKLIRRCEEERDRDAKTRTSSRSKGFFSHETLSRPTPSLPAPTVFTAEAIAVAQLQFPKGMPQSRTARAPDASHR
jgi:hypothetical protein